jgi:hypothetical protein
MASSIQSSNGNPSPLRTRELCQQLLVPLETGNRLAGSTGHSCPKLYDLPKTAVALRHVQHNEHQFQFVRDAVAAKECELIV